MNWPYKSITSMRAPMSIIKTLKFDLNFFLSFFSYCYNILFDVSFLLFFYHRFFINQNLFITFVLRWFCFKYTD